MSTNISVTYCERGYDWCTNVRLVRGVGPKAVRVILRPTPGRYGYENEEDLAIKAAELATQKGWRKIVVAPDDCEGDTIRGFNLHQYHYEQWQKGRLGVFLGFIKP